MITPETELAVNQVVKNIPFNAVRNGQLDQKIVEIIVRHADGKISQVAKCTLEDTASQKTLSDILSKVPSIGGTDTVSSLANNVQTEMVRQEVKKVGKDVKEVLNLTKDISVNVDKLTKSMSIVQGLSFLNSLLSIANLGVSITGFKNVNNQLDKLQGELHNIQYTVNKINCTVSEIKCMEILKVVRDGNDLIHQTEALFQHISDHESDMREFDAVLGAYQSYLEYVRSLMNNQILDYETGYQIIMNLLRSYAELLKNYTIEYYYTHDQRIPGLYDSYLQTILSFAEPSFTEPLFDHLYLDLDLTKTEALKSSQCHLLLVGNAYTKAEDTRYLVSQLPQRKDYDDLQASILKYDQERVESVLSAQ